MRSSIVGFIVLGLLILTPFLSFGQPAGGGPAGEPAVPITGIEFLIAAGGALGIRKLIIAKRSKSSEK